MRYERRSRSTSLSMSYLGPMLRRQSAEARRSGIHTSSRVIAQPRARRARLRRLTSERPSSRRGAFFGRLRDGEEVAEHSGAVRQ